MIEVIVETKANKAELQPSMMFEKKEQICLNLHINYC